MSAAHEPVMVAQVLEALEPKPGARVLDGTLGLGGHAEAILERIGPGGKLVGIDRDAELLGRAQQRLARFGCAARLVQARLSELGSVLEAARVPELDGALFDLGVSSVHLDDPERGFSFRGPAADAALDMRMDRSRGETAAELLERLSEEELSNVLRAGDVPSPRRVASALRARQPLRTCGELADALRGIHLPQRRHHPATLVFQALRMAVNEEASELESALEQAVDALAPGGRLAVLSYHSGEDRRTKQFFAREARGCICPPKLPFCGCGRLPRLALLVRGAGPSQDEVERNPRARSARLRAGRRL